MKQLLISVSLIALVLWSCNEKGISKKSSEMDPLMAFVQGEIAWLQKEQKTLRKTVSRGEELTTETLTNIDWSNELESVTAWSLQEAKKKCVYDETIDSAGALKIVRYNAQDSTAELQELMVNYRKNEIQLMQWTVRQRSWYLDRDLKISFQPKQGYGVWVNENAIWSSPNAYEIFAEIQNAVAQ